VDADDIADVAVAALTEPGHQGQLYELAGPQALTHGEVADAIARATGRPVRYVPVSMEAFTQELARERVPGDVVALLRHLFETVLVPYNAGVADGVQRALGRPPRDVAAFARDAAAGGAWTRPAAPEPPGRPEAAGRCTRAPRAGAVAPEAPAPAASGSGQPPGVTFATRPLNMPSGTGLTSPVALDGRPAASRRRWEISAMSSGFQSGVVTAVCAGRSLGRKPSCGVSTTTSGLPFSGWLPFHTAASSW
jgi:hypothetical protein